jgi:hypothetical protein
MLQSLAPMRFGGRRYYRANGKLCERSLFSTKHSHGGGALTSAYFRLDFAGQVRFFKPAKKEDLWAFKKRYSPPF